MVDERTLLLYLPAMLAMTLAPGADTLFVVGSAMRSGARGGVLAACGIISGGIVHITAAIIGLSALLVQSAVAFSIVKYVGAAYLVYLGVRALISKEPLAEQQPESQPRHVTFVQGFITNATNPKVAVFMLAFLPQFVSPARGAVWTQMLELWAIWYVAGLLWLGAIGYVVGRARKTVSPAGWVKNAFKYATSLVFIGLGVRVALEKR